MPKQANNLMTSANTTAIAPKRIGRLDQLLSLLPFGFGENNPIIAVLRLDGVIGKIGMTKSGMTMKDLNKLIEKTFKIDKLEAVCLVINSPGGSPVQSDLIAKRITALAKEKDVKVFGFVEDVAASGGYWLACAADEIYASHSSIIGSIGVISSGFGFHEAIKKLGIERRVHTEGKTKSVLDPFKPSRDSDVKIIKKIQKEIHQHFIDTVKERRADRLTQSDDILFNGEFWTGQIALDYGLIDGIGDMYSFIQKKYGDKVKIEYIENKQSWIKKKLGMASLSKEFTSDFTDSLVDSLEQKIAYNKFDIAQ
ncbi:S49 family peptidase [Rickettsiaceae bacterium]|nr:S49 family peptidase [Rickettsiaceae bacterium]